MISIKNIVIFKVTSEFFEENGYIVHLDGHEKAVVFDPGSEVDQFLKYLSKKNLIIEAICLTHAHPDHIAGVAGVKEAFPEAKIAIGINEAEALTNPQLNLSTLLGFEMISPKADTTLEDGQNIDFAGINFNIREIPGHSPGHIAYIAKDSRFHIFSGDILFEGSIGRCDFPGGDFKTLISGIKQKLLCLPPDSKVYPGHGSTTTIGEEAKSNPFLN
ncbi:MAG: MBL fold metallo-hydrolase [Planctomycetes bacterium]|nr:MBL fold metallo-hydrolase [Planctomycetota bacterium]